VILTVKNIWRRKYFLRLLLCLMLIACSGCSHEDNNNKDGNSELQIESPPLLLAADFDNLLSTELLALDVDNAPTIFRSIQLRMIALADLSLKGFDDLGASQHLANRLMAKPAARKVTILEASSEKCLQNSDNRDDKIVESNLWNDKNNDKVPSMGDEWIYVSWNCQALDSTTITNGIITYSGMGSQLDITNTEFKNHQMAMNFEISYLAGNSVLFKNAVVVFTRQAQQASFQLTADQIGVLTDGEASYLFKDIEFSASMPYELTNNEQLIAIGRQQISLSGSYYDALLAGYIRFSSLDDYPLNYDFVPAKLSSGEMLLLGALSHGISVSMQPDSDNTLLFTSSTESKNSKQYAWSEVVLTEFNLVQLLTEWESIF